MPTRESRQNNTSARNENIGAICNRIRENNERIREIADLCESENRERTETETNEYNALRRENQELEMRYHAGRTPIPTVSAVDPSRELRENMNNRIPTTIHLTREIQTSAALDDTGIIPIDEQEMLKPLRAGLIYDKVGINVRTGLPAGRLRWPRHGRAIAHFIGEGERVDDSKIDWNKLDVKPERLSVAIPVTREELDSSQGIVEAVVREEMPAAIIDAVNENLFTTEGTFEGTDGKTKDKKCVGPFVKAAENPFVFADTIPTRRELLLMVAKVAASGIVINHGCWVMTETMKAELEDTKVDEGSGRFVCENGQILGYPVFTTPAIGEGNVGFGDWGYQAAGFMGGMDLTVDPYTLARQHATDFVLNTSFATATLYEEAFVLGRKGE